MAFPVRVDRAIASLYSTHIDTVSGGCACASTRANPTAGQVLGLVRTTAFQDPVIWPTGLVGDWPVQGIAWLEPE